MSGSLINKRSVHAVFRYVRSAAYVLASTPVVNTWINGGSVPGRLLIAAVVGALVTTDVAIIRTPIETDTPTPVQVSVPMTIHSPEDPPKIGS